jgi:hypothetical protein
MVLRGISSGDQFVVGVDSEGVHDHRLGANADIECW